MNQEEIAAIQDSGERYIREKYWCLRHKAFLDEAGIPDSQLEAETDRLDALENAELQKYFSSTYRMQ